MSIDMYLSSSDQQSETTGVTLRNQIAAYEGLQASLNQFILASPTLSGKTYESAKAYSNQVLLPLIRACILLDEAVIVATEELPQRYRQEVDVIDLKEWELQEQIDRASGLISRYEELVRTELWKDLPNYDYLNSLRQSISNYEDTKYRLEEKLRKLIEFNWYSASIFTAAEELCYVVQEGMRQANASWNGEAQAFTLPSREQLSWMAGVNQKWTERKNQFEREVDRLSLAELECKYKDVLKANPNTVYIGAGYDGRYVGLKLSPDQAEYIRSRYQILKAQGQETLFVKQMYDNLRREDKEEIDKLTLHELTTAYPYLILPRGSSFEFGSEADYAKKNYLYHRFEYLMAKEPIDWRDHQFMEKLNAQINETGINPFTGKEATEGEKRTAQYYGPAKYGSNILGLITLLAGPAAITKYYDWKSGEIGNFSVVRGKVDGRIPLKEYEKYRTKSIHNPESDTLTLGKYRPTIQADGTENWSIPGPDSYIVKAGDTTYFDLGDDWNTLTRTYDLDTEGREMFKYFNAPALDDAVAQDKVIRFSHDPTLPQYEGQAIDWEWTYLREKHEYTEVIKSGEYWYAIQ